jgi:hypothetical protein
MVQHTTGAFRLARNGQSLALGLGRIGLRSGGYERHYQWSGGRKPWQRSVSAGPNCFVGNTSQTLWGWTAGFGGKFAISSNVSLFADCDRFA